jgi:alkaline phosphatase/alkaline phosphatase D
MAGRVDLTSAILQTRLTQGSQLVDGDLPGAPGVAHFEVATSEDFANAVRTPLLRATEGNDFIVKHKVSGLSPGTRYYYRAVYGVDAPTQTGPTCTFRTLDGAEVARPWRFAVVTGMNYFFFQEGDYKPENAYSGPDKALGYPGLASIAALEPDFFVGTGDNVYFDHPAAGGNRWTGTAWSDAAKTESEMRRKYHEQFVQPRFHELFAKTATYWEVDDHDYRYNDCDNTGDRLPTPEMGKRNFREQLPVTDPALPEDLTYGTFRVSRDLQIWLLEGRQYRTANSMDDGPDKTIWGETQKRWLKQTLLASDAAFKIIISPTPLIGVDGAGKRDSHVNLRGFRHEGEGFLAWCKENGLDEKNLYLLCGDRHWQYHAVHPTGIPEFACGSLVTANSRYGVRSGEANSTDPDGLVKQLYCTLPGEPFNATPSGGFLVVEVRPEGESAVAEFQLYDEFGKLIYGFDTEAQ